MLGMSADSAVSGHLSAVGSRAWCRPVVAGWILHRRGLLWRVELTQTLGLGAKSNLLVVEILPHELSKLGAQCKDLSAQRRNVVIVVALKRVQVVLLENQFLLTVSGQLAVKLHLVQLLDSLQPLALQRNGLAVSSHQHSPDNCRPQRQQHGNLHPAGRAGKEHDDTGNHREHQQHNHENDGGFLRHTIGRTKFRHIIALLICICRISPGVSPSGVAFES